MARYALVVGIAQYAPGIQALEKTTGDAEAVAQVLEEHRYKVTRLPSCPIPNSNKRKMVKRALHTRDLLEAIQTFLFKQARNQEALIYFTGHGLKVEESGKPKGYLVTSDCQLVANKVQGGISFQQLNELISESELSSLVLLLDCCHSGYLIEENLINYSFKMDLEKDYYLIAACRGFEQGKVLSSEEHSVFTGALLKGLSLENTSSTGEISCDRLYEYINKKLKGTSQEPIRIGYGRSIILVDYYQKNIDCTIETITQSVIKKENPYLGLMAFDAEKKDYFFGRVAAVRAIIERLKNSKFLAVIGPSGCGKSSLVKAGILPKLKDDLIPGSSQWQVETIKPGVRPLEELEQALARQEPSKKLLLFIDQFEELFTLCSNEYQQREFIRKITQEASDTGKETRIIVAMRGDFLDRCARYQETANLINRTQPTTYIVTPMSELELTEAIEKPAEKHAVSFETGLVEQIIKDVANQAGALPLLQFALEQLWKVCIIDSDHQRPHLTLKGYQKIGGVKGALEKRADEFYIKFSADKKFVRRLFLQLVQFGEMQEVTRRPASLQNLLNKADSEEQFRRVAEQLASGEYRLIIMDENKVEVVHEALLSEWRLLRDWIEQDRDKLRLERRLEEECQEWDKKERADRWLLVGTWLAAIEDWVKEEQPKLGLLEREFLQKSLERQERERKAEVEKERQLRELAEAKAKAETEKAEEERAKKIAQMERAIAAEDKANAEAARVREVEARVRLQKQRLRLAIGSLIVVILLIIYALANLIDAERSRVLALSEASEAKFNLNRDSLDPLVDALKAGAGLKRIDWIPGNKKLHSHVIETLTQAVYWVREIARLQAHGRTVQSVSFSPDGTLLASASYDNTVKLWDITKNTSIQINSKKITSLKHDKAVFSVIFSPNSKIIATASFDKTVKLWKRDGTLIQTLPHNDRVYSVTFIFDDNAIATGEEDGTVTLWNTNGQRIGKPFQAHQGTVMDLKFNKQKNILATASVDGTVKLWKLTSNLQQKKQVEILQHPNNSEPDKSINSVSFSPDNQRIATASRDKTVQFWRWDGTLLKNLTIRGTSGFTSVSFSPNKKTIATANLAGQVQLWEQNGEQEIKEVGTIDAHSNRVNSISFGDNGNILVSGSNDSQIKLWQVKLPLVTHIKKADSQQVLYVNFNPNGQNFVSAGQDNTLKVWDKDGTLKQVLQGHTEQVNSVDFSPLNGEIIASSSYDDTVKLWTLQGEKYQLQKTIDRKSNFNSSSSVSFNPNKNHSLLAFADSTGIVKLLNLDGTKKEFKAHSKEIWAVNFSSNGDYIATASGDRTAQIWDIKEKNKREPIAVATLAGVEGHQAAVRDIRFHPEFPQISLIATASEDKTVKLWNFSDTKVVKNIIDHSDRVTRVRFSPDGKKIASASDDRTIKLWNLDGTLITTFKGHDRAVNGISFNRDSDVLISGSSDGTIIIWRVKVEDLTLDRLLKRGCNYLQVNSQAPKDICKN